MMRSAFCATIALTSMSLSALVLSGCDDAASSQAEVPGEVVADKLEQAAAQSSPAAKEVLKASADDARQRDHLPPVDEPGAFAQDAMQKAGNAEDKPSPESS